MMILLDLLVLAAASAAFLVTDRQQAKDAFCKIECIEYQARPPRNY